MSRKPAASEPGWDSGSHCDVRQYRAARRAGGNQDAIRAALVQAAGGAGRALNVADVGCGAGAQARLWAAHGHQVYGADSDAALVALARRRAAAAGLEIMFDHAAATALPWPDQSMDVCIAPGQLAHMADWRGCTAELLRVLRPGGVLYIRTTNALCPSQQEFRLPLYPWYPRWLKRRCEQLARTSRPALANYTASPALNWFTYYGLRRHFARHGLRCLDRFDLAEPAGRGVAARAAIALVRAAAPLRFCAHVATPYTLLVAVKPAR